MADSLYAGGAHGINEQLDLPPYGDEATMLERLRTALYTPSTFED